MFQYEKHIHETKNIYMATITYRMYMFISTYFKEHINVTKTIYMLKINMQNIYVLYKTTYIYIQKKHIYMTKITYNMYMFL